MNIHSIQVKRYRYGHFHNSMEGITQVKALSFLSVVQSQTGSYRVRLDEDSLEYQTGAGGVFIAPAGVMQHLIHHDDTVTGSMAARWVFLDILVNDYYRLDSLYNFPVLMPPQYQEELNDILQLLSTESGICRDLSAIYRLIDILLQIGTPKALRDEAIETIISYVEAHYREPITADLLADLLHISRSSLYRRFESAFHQSPANYINGIRIQNAALLLSETELPIVKVAEEVGFGDMFYFSKLFKKSFGISPSGYRSQMKSLIPLHSSNPAAECTHTG